MRASGPRQPPTHQLRPACQSFSMVRGGTLPRGTSDPPASRAVSPRIQEPQEMPFLENRASVLNRFETRGDPPTQAVCTPESDPNLRTG